METKIGLLIEVINSGRWVTYSQPSLPVGREMISRGGSPSPSVHAIYLIFLLGFLKTPYLPQVPT